MKTDKSDLESNLDYFLSKNQTLDLNQLRNSARVTKKESTDFKFEFEADKDAPNQNWDMVGENSYRFISKQSSIKNINGLVKGLQNQHTESLKKFQFWNPADDSRLTLFGVTRGNTEEEIPTNRSKGRTIQGLKQPVLPPYAAEIEDMIKISEAGSPQHAPGQNHKLQGQQHIGLFEGSPVTHPTYGNSPENYGEKVSSSPPPHQIHRNYSMGPGDTNNTSIIKAIHQPTYSFPVGVIEKSLNESAMNHSHIRNYSINRHNNSNFLAKKSVDCDDSMYFGFGAQLNARKSPDDSDAASDGPLRKGIDEVESMKYRSYNI